jgi:hypothetical protein
MNMRVIISWIVVLALMAGFSLAVWPIWRRLTKAQQGSIVHGINLAFCFAVLFFQFRGEFELAVMSAVGMLCFYLAHWIFFRRDELLAKKQPKSTKAP